MAVFPHGSTPRAAVVPIGNPPERACAAVAETLRETFDLSVPIQDAIESPSDDVADDDSVEAYLESIDAVPFLEALEAQTEGIDLAVGVTDSRLALEDDYGLFGVGLEFGTVGIVSTGTLLEGGEPTELERERLATETLSVTGAMLGLKSYCHDGGDGQPCPCTPGDVLSQLDEVPTTYCSDCRNALTGESPVLEAPTPETWIVGPRDRETLEFGDRWERGELLWRDYPFVVLGTVVSRAQRFGSRLRPVLNWPRKLLGWVPRPGPGDARKIPQPVHTTYRILSFWGNVFFYLFWIFVWLWAFVDVHSRLLGSEFSTGALVALLVVGLLGGIVTGVFVKSIVRGVYDGVRGTPAGER